MVYLATEISPMNILNLINFAIEDRELWVKYDIFEVIQNYCTAAYNEHQHATSLKYGDSVWMYSPISYVWIMYRVRNWDDEPATKNRNRIKKYERKRN